MLAARLAALLVCAALPVSVAAQRLSEKMEPRSFELEDGGALPYRIFEPERKKGEKLPLVLFLHGAGERGDDNRRQLRHAVRSFIDGQMVRPCIVAAPQCPRGQWWNTDHVVAFAEEMRALDGVDQDRVYLTGLSMGGYATWHVAGMRPELFAAAIPVCGGGQTKDAEKLTGIPIWAFHGDGDRTVRPEASREMVQAIRDAGGELRYTEYPGVGHDSWTQTYADPRVHEWLFDQRRSVPIMLKDGDRVAFFGDSITEAGARGKGYIRLMDADLRARDEDSKIELIGAGISGHKVPDLQKRLDKDVLSHEPTIVIIYIGINDVWHWGGGTGTKKDDFDEGLRELADRIIASGARLILCTPSVIGEKTDGSNKFDEMLDDYSSVTRAVAADTGAQLLDLRAQFLQHLKAHNSEQLGQGILTSDSVHLNGAGNRFVADCMLEALGVDAAGRDK